MSEQGPPPGARPGRPPAGRAPVKKRAAPAKKRAAAPPPSGSGGTGEQQTVVGAALIAVAVLLGLVLLVKGFTDEGGPVATDDPTVTETSVPAVDRDAAPEVDPTETTTTTVAARDPASVSVVVANGSGVAGVAGETASVLEGVGYTIVDTTNASPVSATQVLYVEGAEADAAAIAGLLGLAADAAAPVPDPPPVDLAGADVVVIVGPDLASGPITTATTTAAGATSTTASTTTTTAGSG